MKSNKTKVSILIGILVILLLPLMAGCVQTKDYYDCNMVIHEGEIIFALNGDTDSIVFKDGASFTASDIWILNRSGDLDACYPEYDGVSYKLLRCQKHSNQLMLVPSNLPSPTQYTPFNPQKDCDCGK